MTKLNVTQDQMGNEVLVPHSPKRIISLVPSQTELLFDLGLDNEIAGVTKFCVHPGHARSKTIIGGTKKFNFKKIDDLSPDLILGNKEENYAEGIHRLQETYPVWMSDIFDLKDAIQMIIQVGQMVNKADVANDLAKKINHKFSGLTNGIAAKGRAIYLIWKKPYMAVGSNTFINIMLKYAGFENAAAHLARYPELSLEDIKALKPDHLLLSSEPFPFNAEHVQELSSTLKGVNVQRVDGEYFSWYGSRLLEAADYLGSLAV